MNDQNPAAELVASGRNVALRRIAAADLVRISQFPFSVAIDSPLDKLSDLAAAFARSGFWRDEAGAVAIARADSTDMIGTIHFYRSAPCIHGFELGYIVHDPADRGSGIASEAVALFRDHLFRTSSVHRLQLVIATWNVASWKLVERCGFVREGLLRSAGFGAGDPSDCFIYAQTRKDWREGQARPVELGGTLPAATGA